MTRRSVCFALPLAVFALASGVGLRAQMTGKSPSARDAIEAANKTFIAAAAKGDTAAMAAIYTEDAAAYPANAEIVSGRPSIQGFWKTVIDSGITDVALNTTEVESSGDLAYESGTYTMKMKDGAVADRGKYVVVWKRVKGQWLIHRDIWTTNLPAQKK